jgi:broad specificity phosphatase PhoE
MATLWLVRHGQAGDLLGDYDRLSELGWSQARRAGEGWRPLAPVHHVVTGSMRRHRETAEGFAEGFGGLPEAVVDPAWNEFDHQAVIRAWVAAEGPPEGADRRAFFTLFGHAMGRWASGDHDDDYPESYAAFAARVEEGLQRVIDGLGSGQTGLVFTSGGVVSMVVAELLGVGPRQRFALNTAMRNTSFTQLRVGAGRRSLVSFNEVSHLRDQPDWITHA